MVVSRSDSKRRKKEVTSAQGSPKRTKVHAQRKFAQGSQLNSPSLTPVKDKDKGKNNGSAPPADLLPIKRPKTEEFVNFLCFRGSDMLPKSLEFFNEPSILEPLDLGTKNDVNSAGSSKGHRSTDKHADQSGTKGDKGKGKPKSAAAVQALKKKYQEQRLAKGKLSLTKLVQKVKGKSVVRTRSAGPPDETPAKTVKGTKKPNKGARVVASKLAAKRKPVLRKQSAPVKRFVAKTNARGGLRSGGELPPGSDAGIKTDRKPRKIIKLKKPVKTQKLKKAVVASRRAEVSSDDDQPLAKKKPVLPKKAMLTRKVTTRSRIALKINSKLQRPSRKTKEAATIFMEMLGKDLRSPEEDENADAMSVEEFQEDSTPKRIPAQKEKENQEKKGSQIKKEKENKKDNDNKSSNKPNQKDKVKKPTRSQPDITKNKNAGNEIKKTRQVLIDQSKSKSRLLRRNSHRLVKKELEIQRSRLRIPRRPIRAVPKPILKEIDSNESEEEVEEDEEEPEAKSVTVEKKDKKASNSDSNKKTQVVKPTTTQSKSSQSSTKTNKIQKSIESSFDESDEEPLKGKIKDLGDKDLSKKNLASQDKKTRSGQIRPGVQNSTRSKVTNTVKNDLEKTSNTQDETQSVSKKPLSQKSETKTEEKSATQVTKNKGKRKLESESPTRLSERQKPTSSSSKRPRGEESKDKCVSEELPSELNDSLKSTKKEITIDHTPLEQKNKNPVTKETEPNKVPKTKDSGEKKDEIVDIVVNNDECKNSKSIERSNKAKDSKEIPKQTTCKKASDKHSNKEESVSVKEQPKKQIKNAPKTSKQEIKSANVQKSDKTTSKPTPNNSLGGLDRVKAKTQNKSSNQVSGKKLQQEEVLKSKAETEEHNALCSLSKTPPNKPLEQESPVTPEVAKDNPIVGKNINAEEKPNPLDTLTPDTSSTKTDPSCKLLETVANNSTNKSTKKRLETSKQEAVCKDNALNTNQRISLDSKKIDNNISINQNLVLNSMQPKTQISVQQAKTNLTEPMNVIAPKNTSTDSQFRDKQEKQATKDIKSTLSHKTGQDVKESFELRKNDSSEKSDAKSVEVLSNKSMSNDILISNNEIDCQSSKEKTSHKEYKPTISEQDLELQKVLSHVHQEVEAFTTDIVPCTETKPTMVSSQNKIQTPLELTNTQTSQSINYVNETTNNVSSKMIITMQTNQPIDVKVSEKKSILKTESSLESRIKMESSEMTEKVYSAIDSLMKLKNQQKPEEKQEMSYPSINILKVNKVHEQLEPKRLQEQDVKRLVETDFKRGNEVIDVKRVKFQENEVKRVPEHEVKRVTIIEPEIKRNFMQESDFRRFQPQENKPKPGPSQVLKGCANPKSMLKPGTLIDIAGISHSPDIMAPLRPGVEGEIIPMNRPVRMDMPDPYRMSLPGMKPYEPKPEQQFYNYRPPPVPSIDKSSFKVNPQEKEPTDPKAKAPVNENAWRLAFKNVKDPKTNANIPAEKPVDRKQLSVTALAKRHTIKSKTEVKEKVVTTQPAVPFFRQNKPFVTLSPNKNKPSTVTKSPETKKNNSSIDPSVLREKEAEIEDFVRQMYVEKEMGKSFAPIVVPQTSSSSRTIQETAVKIETNVSYEPLFNKDQLVLSQTPQQEAGKPLSIPQFQQISSASTQNYATNPVQVCAPSQDQNLASVDLPKVQGFQKSQTIKSTPEKNVECNVNTTLISFSTQKPIAQLTHSSQNVPSSGVSTPQNQTSETASKHSSHHSAPSGSQSPVVEENLFRDSNNPKRTKSPLSYPQPVARSSSPQSVFAKRNTNSPTSMRPSRNIFKEVVPATRSFSPTSSNTSQTDNETGNIFSQNSPFKRSISPLCNKPLNVANFPVTDPTVVSKQSTPTSPIVVASPAQIFIHQQLSTLAATAILQSDLNLAQKAALIDPSIKKEVTELTETANQNEISDIIQDKVSKVTNVFPGTPTKQEHSKSNNGSLPLASNSLGSNKIPSTDTKIDSRLSPMSTSQTFQTIEQLKPSTSAKTTSAKSNLNELSVDPSLNKGVNKDIVNKPAGIISPKPISPVQSKQSTSIYNQEYDLDLMSNKKVNMSTEEISRWLNESSNSVIEHRVNCGILENNSCECEHKIIDDQHNIDVMKSKGSTKSGNLQAKAEIQSDLVSSVEGSKEKPKRIQKLNLAAKEDSATNKEISTANSSSNEQVSGNNSKSLSDQKAVNNLTSKPSLSTPIKNSESNTKDPSAPNTPVSKRGTRSFKQHLEQDSGLEFSEVASPPLRDDVSSSNISSSNEETPDKFLHPERRSIFHQRRSTLKVKERKELLPPSTNAFSPENESSVYAFEPDLPPASTPFRRSKPKDNKTSTAVVNEDDLPSSNSIAVQVNFDNEAVLECSTQTDVQEADDDDTHTFYIPLQQNTTDTTKPPMIQGVAVKLDTEGPDQKVIMRAKLVTKPLSTFNQTTSSPARSLMGARSGGKPEQKVRPLSVKPPVGTVQPTARPKPKPTSVKEEEPSPSTSKDTSCNTSPQATRLAKRLKNRTSSSSETNNAPKVDHAKLVEVAPTFYPTEKEFEDPLAYINKITPQAEKYGLCRVVPPKNFKPECKVSDDMRFTAYNQYIHKMMHRWGPNVKEMLAIKKYLATQKIALTHPPWIGGMEVDLPRLYQTVQQFGGLMEVIEKKRWHKVADSMKIPKSAQDRVTKLDDIYCKFLLPYDTLSHDERTKLFEDVEKDWMEREKKIDDSQDEDDESDSESDIDECIVKGRSMALNGFFRIARNTMSMWFPKTETPSAGDVELEFWKHVASRQHHVCVHAGSIDTGSAGYGFPTGKNSTTSRHPWNLKMLTNNPGSILRFLGPIIGVTVPTLHVGMLFSACCWYRDPHGLAWIEYLHTGASKIWYGIPDSSSNQFRSAVTSLVPRLVQDKQLWLASDQAMVPPPLLVDKGVSLSRIVQEPGQFIIVFPKAFTSNICTGYVVSESVYFAQPSWLTAAQNLFYEMRESCEPTVFSFEKLLFDIVNDSRSNSEVLNQILPIVVSLRDGEIAGRRQLEELGLNSSERINTGKGRKSRPANDEDEDYECEKCRTNLFISFMRNSHDGSVYCLPHAVELLTHKRSQVKHCTLVYSFSEDELEDLVEKLKSRAENKNQKKTQSKSSKS